MWPTRTTRSRWRATTSGERSSRPARGIQDVWGVYKIPTQPWVYASDRNGGLYVLKEKGSGSGKAKKATP